MISFITGYNSWTTMMFPRKVNAFVKKKGIITVFAIL